MQIPSRDQESFYRSAILGLRALEVRERVPRRFGADADARWAQLAGALGPGDRIDVLLRDAAGAWGAAFSPAVCFGLFGLAEDEPFGPDWRPLDDMAARRLIASPEVPVTLEQAASHLGVQLAPVPVPKLTPATKLVVAGGAAIVAVAAAFAKGQGLSWTDQVAVVADRPAPRQLAGLAAVFLGARGRTVLVRPGADGQAALRAQGFAHLDAAVVSADAAPAEADLARAVGGA